MKIRALKAFEGIRDNERNVYPKAGEVWEVSEERANFLKSHGVIEFVEEVKEETPKVKPEVNIDGKKIEEKIIEVEPKIIKTNDEIKVKKDNVEVIINKNEILKEIKKQSKKKKTSKK